MSRLNSAVCGINPTLGESRTKYKYTKWISVEFMNIKAAGSEGRVMFCGHTACPKMCLDAARPVITRYGVCSLIHVVKLPAVTERYGSSPCSQNPLNPALAVSHCFSSYLCSCRRPIRCSHPPSCSTNTPPVMQSEFHYHVHKSKDPVLKQVLPVHTFPSYLL